MPLENATQTDTIPELNETWPTGQDAYSQGDDHIRLIKKVLKSTFPNLTSPITVSSEVINRGSIPMGSVMLFYQATAPLGWVRESVALTYGIRVVSAVMTGGVAGGVDDPVLNNKVPEHTHGVSLDTQSGGEHTHSVSGSTTRENLNHTHLYNGARYFSAAITTGSASLNVHAHDVNANAAYTDVGHSHAMSATAATAGAHQHTLSGASQGVTGGAQNWSPRYLDCILCRRTS